MPILTLGRHCFSQENHANSLASSEQVEEVHFLADCSVQDGGHTATLA